MEPSTPTALQQVALYAQIGFYAVTATSIGIAGIAAIIKYKLFRTGRPFVSVSLEASSRPCSAEQIQVGVTAKLHNGSKVLAKADTLEWECRGLATYDDDAIEEKINEYFLRADGDVRHARSDSEFPWNVQQRITKSDQGLTIEPNETGHDNVTFVVPRYCTAVQIRLFIPTPRRRNLGWTAVTYHDIRTQEAP